VTLGPDVLDWVVAAVGSGAQVLTIDELPPSSTEKHVVTLGTHRGIVRVVTRRYHDRERLEMDFAYAPANEVRALAIVGASSVPAPRLYAADLDGTVAGAPLLLEGWVPGAAAWEVGADDTYLAAAAEVLVRIHAITPPEPGVVMSYRPYRDPTESLVLGRGSERLEVWQRVAELLESPAPDAPRRFIHRDFHPGNALWDGGAIQVVDWATAAIGPAGIDLARMRQNLASWHGTAAADRFVSLYADAGGDPAARHPYWDLLDAADLWLDRDVEAPGDGDLGRFEHYVASVVAEMV
jgi:aminoglycoside phosphotransferase (APT) family kinase protein